MKARSLWFVLFAASMLAPAAMADPDAFRCFESVGVKPPIRLEIVFPGANDQGGYVRYEHGGERIPIVSVATDLAAPMPKDRPGEFVSTFREVAPGGSGGEYVMTSQGAVVYDFRYIRKRDGKVFRFKEDGSASGEDSCTWAR